MVFVKYTVWTKIINKKVVIVDNSVHETLPCVSEWCSWESNHIDDYKRNLKIYGSY